MRILISSAGWHGLVAAKTYLELHPQEEVLLVEAESSCGGTWSANRLYVRPKSVGSSGSELTWLALTV